MFLNVYLFWLVVPYQVLLFPDAAKFVILSVILTLNVPTDEY